MLTHVVLFRFLPGADKSGPAAQDFHAAMRALPAQITEIVQWQCDFSQVADPLAADYVLVAGFRDLAALEAYVAHPAHVAVVERLEGFAEILFGDIPG